MEEISTRFEIIRLAVKLGDFRTIDLQCEKLRSLSLDEKLNEIIDLLESRNYRQALYEMKHYSSTLEDEFFSEKEPKKESRSSVRNLGLFETDEPEEDDEDEHVLNLDDILTLSKKRERSSISSYESPSPVPENEPTVPSAKKETMPGEERSGYGEESKQAEKENTERIVEANRPEISKEAVKTHEKVSPVFREEEWISEETPAGEHSRVLSSETVESEPDTRPTSPRHPPISYISQKFRNMIHQFPPVEQEEMSMPESVKRMQKQISTEGYTEEEIEAFLKEYQRYKEEGKRSEAAMVLLLAAATESKFAQFLLARELFRGEILQRDHAEAFTQINTLADQNFAEAICDLGQFYEHGIGIGKDRQMALLLYEEAAEMGIARAQKHYERLKNSRGLMGMFKKVGLPKVPRPKKS